MDKCLTKHTPRKLGPFFYETETYQEFYKLPEERDPVWDDEKKVKTMKGIWEPKAPLLDVKPLNFSGICNFGFPSREAEETKSDGLSSILFRPDVTRTSSLACQFADDLLDEVMLAKTLPEVDLSQYEESLSPEMFDKRPNVQRKLSLESSQSLSSQEFGSARSAGSSTPTNFYKSSSSSNSSITIRSEEEMDLDKMATQFKLSCNVQASDVEKAARPRLGTTRADMADFAHKFGYGGTPRASLLYRPRKGKYRKEF